MIWDMHIITLMAIRYNVALVYHSTVYPDYIKVSETIYPSIRQGQLRLCLRVIYKIDLLL